MSDPYGTPEAAEEIEADLVRDERRDEPAERRQWRVVAVASDGRGFVCFLDAPTEASARAFFASSFPRHRIESIALEPADPCAQYERKP